MTIYRLCALHRAEQTRNFVISPDSDYSYIPSCNEVDGVLSMVRKQPGATRYLKSPWELTNVSSLQSLIPAFPWQTDVQRLLAVTLAGHDYCPGGVQNLGLKTMWEELPPSFIAPPRLPPRTALAADNSPQPRTAKRVILALDSEDEQPAPVGRAVPSAVTLPSVRNAESARSLEPDSKVRKLASRLPRTSTTSSRPSLMKRVRSESSIACRPCDSSRSQRGYSRNRSRRPFYTKSLAQKPITGKPKSSFIWRCKVWKSRT